MSKKHKTSQPPSSKRSAMRTQRATQQKRNRLLMGLGLAALAILVVAFLIKPKSTAPIEISASAAYQKFLEGAFVLDVRTQEEWAQAHIEGSTSIPLDELSNHLDELPQDRDILVVCLLETRSKEGVNILRQAGFSRTSCISGGLQAWNSAGYPLISSTP